MTPITPPPQSIRVELVHKAVKTLGRRSLAADAVVTKPKLTVETVPLVGEMLQPLGVLHNYHTGLWHVKCPTFCSVCSSFGPAVPPCPCLLLLWLLLQLLPTLCQLSPPCILPSAPLPAAAGLSSRLSCYWCTPWIKCGQVEDVIEDGVGPPIWSGTSTLYWCCCSTSQTLALPSPHYRCPHLCAGAQDADFLPWLSLVQSQSRIRVEQLRLLYQEAGNSHFCLPMVPTRLYNATISYLTHK